MPPRRGGLVVIVVGALASCATPGSKPGDMSAAGHEAAATDAQRKSAQHGAAYEPGAIEERWHCDQEGPCWTSLENPTQAHRSEMERYARIAADHRSASRALHEAEAESCRGIPERDRVLSPFYHREDIFSVQPLRVPGSHTTPVLQGAVVAFRSVPGLTQESLRRLIACHQARNAVAGFNDAEIAYCPLAVRDVKANVTSSGGRLVVELRSYDPRTAREILRRARHLGRNP